MSLMMYPASCIQTPACWNESSSEVQFGAGPHPLSLGERSGPLSASGWHRGSLDETLNPWSYCILHVRVHYLVGEGESNKKKGKK